MKRAEGLGLVARLRRAAAHRESEKTRALGVKLHQALSFCRSHDEQPAAQGGRQTQTARPSRVVLHGPPWPTKVNSRTYAGGGSGWRLSRAYEAVTSTPYRRITADRNTHTRKAMT